MEHVTNSGKITETHHFFDLPQNLLDVGVLSDVLLESTIPGEGFELQLVAHFS